MVFKGSNVVKKFKLSEITLNITDGEHGTVQDDKNGKYYLLSCKNVKNGNINITQSDRIISKESFDKIQKRIKLEKNDILITTVGTIGEMAIIKTDEINYCFQRSVGIIKPNPKIVNPYFMYYALKKEMRQIGTFVKGAVQKCLFINDMKLIEIEIPDIINQEKIVKILNNIDKKIELNNQISDNLLEMSQLIFSNYINENKSINYCKIKDLNPKLETGKRPNGGVGNILNGIPSIGAESIKKVGYFDYSKTKYVTEEYFEKMKKGIVKGYEILIYKDGGKPGYFMPNFSMFGEGFPYERCAVNEHVFLLDFNSIRFNIFYYYYFNSEEIRHKLHVLGSKSAAIPGINQQDILNLEIPCVKEKDAYELFDILEFNTKMIIKNSKQNHKLCQLRDTLLPKLMNGEIDLDKIEI